jgi:hypothetical protein
MTAQPRGRGSQASQSRSWRRDGPIGVEVIKVISTCKTSKHFAVTITDASLVIERD